MNRNDFEVIARFCKKADYIPEQNWHRVQLIGGSTVYLRDEDQSLAPHIIEDGYWESWISAWLHEELIMGDYKTFIDVGANCGYFSVIADPHVEQTILVEANPDLQPALIMTAFGGMKSITTIVPYAMWDEDETELELRIPDALIGSASVVDEVDFSGYGIKSYTVPAVTMDTVMRDFTTIPGGMIIKIDAESAEERIWRGMQNVLKEYKPTVFMEYTPGMYSDHFLDDILEYGDISVINYDGSESIVFPQELENSQDWAMIVIRPKE